MNAPMNDATNAAAPRVLVIGDTVIPYTVRMSARAKRQRLVVTPAGVELVAPVGTPEAAMQQLMRHKRRWVFDAVHAVNERHRALLAQRYASGAKLQVRGRWLTLVLHEAGPAEGVTVALRGQVHLSVPNTLAPDARLPALSAAVDAWLRGRASDDLDRLGRTWAARLNVTPTALRLTDARARWGSCGRDGVVRVHWRLAQAPLAAMEYVIAHELTHLRHRHHGPAFWLALAEVMPDWSLRKALLERWEVNRREL